MTNTIRAGARDSPLAVAQTNDAIERWQERVPGVRFELVPFASPGDRDHATDLRDTPPDFFTRDLDDAVLDGSLDLAVHSSKDVPAELREGLDWFWLPWRADPRDVIVMRAGETLDDLAAEACVGISSERREQWAKEFYPQARLSSIRGNIGSRMEQLDRGDYDMLLMAGAAMIRLDIEERITRWIPLSEIPVPEGQGYLSVTFRKGDKRILALRSLFMKPAVLAGAGPGDPGLITVSAEEALSHCDVCLHDALVSDGVLALIPDSVRRINVGKRCGKHYVPQPEISAMLADFVRKGFRVVRLKGGDPGLFGRLSDELDALVQGMLPYKVIPGVSSLCAATSGTGLLLTRRGVSRGFTVMTPRMAGGASQPVSGDFRRELPLVFFMAVSRVREMAEDLLLEGRSPDEPACMASSIGLADEEMIFGTLSTIAEMTKGSITEKAGLLIVGTISSREYLYSSSGSALAGERVMITCSSGILSKAERCVHDVGGRIISMPMIRSVRSPDALGALKDIGRYDWVAVTSPAAVHHLMAGLEEAGSDVRSLPAMMTCGPGSADALSTYGLFPDIVPEDDFGRAGLLKVADTGLMAGSRLLRIRSDVAGGELSDGLKKIGYEVEDCELYSTVSVPYDVLPEYDSIVFCSGSAVRAYIGNFGVDSVNGKTVIAMGFPTEQALAAAGVDRVTLALDATIEGCVQTLAASRIVEQLRSIEN